MKISNYLFSALAFTFCLILVSPTLKSQSNGNTYFAVQYLKVQPNQESEYLRLELEVWKKMQQARIKADVVDAWYFFRVVAPIGSATEYNYVTINQYDNAEKLAGHFENFGVDYNTILTPEEISLALRTEEIRELVYEEVWTTVDQVTKENPEKMYRFQVFNSMKLLDDTDGDDYQRIETTYWKPMHEARIKDGKMFGWGLYTMIIPGGTERNYHWATVDYYDKFMDYLSDNAAIFENIHGKVKADKFTEETIAKRDLLKAEVRELVDYVTESTVQSQ